MYKPGTQLIMNQLWAAAAAHDLGFEVESFWQASRGVWTKDFCLYMIEGASLTRIDKWRITVTESGPNAAERFYPQRGDLVETVTDTSFIVTELLDDDPVWVGNRNQSGIQNPFAECRRIIERNGTPFPQFSEAIEP
jgi:hypothetical protein